MLVQRSRAGRSILNNSDSLFSQVSPNASTGSCCRTRKSNVISCLHIGDVERVIDRVHGNIEERRSDARYATLNIERQRIDLENIVVR